MAFPVVPVVLGLSAAAVLTYALMGSSGASVSQKKSGTAPTGKSPSLACAKGGADGKEAGEFDFVSGLAKGDSGTPSATKAAASGSAADYIRCFKDAYEVSYNAAKLVAGGSKGLSDVLGTYGVSGDTTGAPTGTSEKPDVNAAYAKIAFDAGKKAGEIDGTRDGAESPLDTAPHPNPQPDPGATSFYKTSYVRGYTEGYGPKFAEYQARKRDAKMSPTVKPYAMSEEEWDAAKAEGGADSPDWWGTDETDTSTSGVWTGQGVGHGGGGGGGAARGGSAGQANMPAGGAPAGLLSRGGGGMMTMARPHPMPSRPAGHGAWGPRRHAIYDAHRHRYPRGGTTGFFGWWPWWGQGYWGGEYEYGYRLGSDDCRRGLMRNTSDMSYRAAVGYEDGRQAMGCEVSAVYAQTSGTEDLAGAARWTAPAARAPSTGPGAELFAYGQRIGADARTASRPYDVSDAYEVVLGYVRQHPGYSHDRPWYLLMANEYKLGYADGWKSAGGGAVASAKSDMWQHAASWEVAPRGRGSNLNAQPVSASATSPMSKGDCYNWGFSRGRSDRGEGRAYNEDTAVASSEIYVAPSSPEISPKGPAYPEGCADMIIQGYKNGYGRVQSKPISISIQNKPDRKMALPLGGGMYRHADGRVDTNPYDDEVYFESGAQPGEVFSSAPVYNYVAPKAPVVPRVTPVEAQFQYAGTSKSAATSIRGDFNYMSSSAPMAASPMAAAQSLSDTQANIPQGYVPDTPVLYTGPPKPQFQYAGKRGGTPVATPIGRVSENDEYWNGFEFGRIDGHNNYLNSTATGTARVLSPGVSADFRRGYGDGWKKGQYDLGFERGKSDCASRKKQVDDYIARYGKSVGNMFAPRLSRADFYLPSMFRTSDSINGWHNGAIASGCFLNKSGKAYNVFPNVD